MNHHQAVGLYSQIFNPQVVKNSQLYRSIFTTAIHTESLLSVLISNSELTLNYPSHQNVWIIQDILSVGLKLLSDAVEFPEDEDSKIPLTSRRRSTTTSNVSNKDLDQLNLPSSRRKSSSSYAIELDDGGDDITALNGNNNPSTEFDDGDDITNFNASKSSQNLQQSSSVLSDIPQPSIAIAMSNSGSVSISESSQLNQIPVDVSPNNSNANSNSNITSRRDSTTSLIQPSISTRLRNPSLSSIDQKEFEGIDLDLRLELITNILAVLKVWFLTISEVNDKAKRRKGSVVTYQSSSELMTNYFGNPGNKQSLDHTSLLKLLTILRWYLNKSLTEIEISKSQDFKNLLAIKEILYLISDILKSIYSSIVFYKEGDNEYSIIQSLLFTFYKVDFSKQLYKILSLTNTKINDTNETTTDTTTEYQASKIRLSFESLMKIYSIISILVMIPEDLLPINPVSLSSDITNLNHESPNPYEQFLHNEIIFDKQTFNVDFASRLNPILAIDFNYCYKFRPDLLIESLQSSSFLTWLSWSSFNNDLYVTFDTISTVTNLQINYETFSLTKNKHEPYLLELNSIYEKRLKLQSQAKFEDEDELIIPELLPITMLIYTYIDKNESFITQFLLQQYPIHHAIEDINPIEDKTIELFDIWLCVLSYVFQYQYKSNSFQMIVRISLISLLKLIKKSPQLFKQHNINEFKWKLSHQKSPSIPIMKGKVGIKPSLFYILDIIQNLIRFNLTNKLNLGNFKLALNLIYQIFQEFKLDVNIELGNYNWKEFFITLFNLLNFIKRQNLVNSKYFIILNQVDILKSIIEEGLILINCLLIPRFNRIVQAQDLEGDSIAHNGGIFGSHTYKSINYDLIYNILLNYETINDYFQLYKLTTDLNNLEQCLKYFEQQFHLTEESKLNASDDANSSKLDLFDHDFDSPVLIDKIQSFTLMDGQVSTTNGNSNKNGNGHIIGQPHYQYKDTLKYALQDRVKLEDEYTIRLFQSLLSLKLG
ncbi:uncharacterized protein RJT21DRAFT_9642 [Scheffersomyces amazonensis]|uniref:uncharacterized protein n=1 Tax=Scheffersomyces amazonensis TaxID=1078765 RepID=UPI00315DC092